MSCTRNEIVKQAQAWVGLKEADGSHKKVIDIYNTLSPLPRGYKLSYKDPWCAGTISALAVACNATDIIPVECSCTRMIEKAKAMGIWVESDAHRPAPGDILMYDWDDNGKGENTNNPEHVGIVEKTDGSTITVIEGNYSNSVKRRTLNVDGLYIRGYAVPKYDNETATEPEQNDGLALRILKKGDKGEDVRALQILLAGNGCKGDMFEAGYGSFGANTEGAVKLYQQKIGVPQTGVADETVWRSLLGIN